MLFLGDSERDRLLAAAFDEPCEPYAVARAGRPPMVLRPFSVGVFRRALTIGIEAVRVGFDAVAADDLRLVEDCEALAWLLTADERVIGAAMRARRWKVAIAEEARGLDLSDLTVVRVEVERHLRLVRAAMFGVVKRAALSEAMEKAEADEKSMEPADLLSPPRLAALSLTVYRDTGWPEDFVQEQLPLCRLLQYAHGIQWSNAQVWTVDPEGESVGAGGDPLAGLDEIREVRQPVAIEF